MKVARSSPAVTVGRWPMARPGTFVCSVKLSFVTPLAKSAVESVIVTSAPFRLASARGDGRLVSVATGVATMTTVSSTARSLSARLSSPSWAWMVTGLVPVTVGVPQMVRAAQFGAPKERPIGRPLTVYS